MLVITVCFFLTHTLVVSHYQSGSSVVQDHWYFFPFCNISYDFLFMLCLFHVSMFCKLRWQIYSLCEKFLACICLCGLVVESPRQHSLMDRPPTRSGNSGSDLPDRGLDFTEKKAEPAPKQASKPGIIHTQSYKVKDIHWGWAEFSFLFNVTKTTTEIKTSI